MSPSLPLVEQLKVLEQLQEIDLKIDALRKNKNSLPETLKNLDDQLAKLHASADAKKIHGGEIEKIQKQTRAALDLNNDRLARSNGKLEGVHNSHEFQAANKEIEQLKKLNLTLDEQLKKAEKDMEALQVEVTALSEQMTKLQAERDVEAEKLNGVGSQIESEIGVLVTERGKYTDKVEMRLIAQYDRVRGARGGLGIAPAVGGRCKACNMMVPPQLYNEVQKGNAVHGCPSCHRILIIPSTSTSQSTTAAVS